MDNTFVHSDFPRSSKYHPDWIRASVSGGANPLWLTEWLTGALDLRPGMRVLDLGCGRAMSSIFLNREFGVQVWAVDLMISASENLQRIRDAGAVDGVFPLKADARLLPFAAEFFDVVISIDSFFYYGTDDLYLNEILRFIKPQGYLAIAGAGLMKEIDGPLPEHLLKWWTPDVWCLHSANWWRRHWARTNLVSVELTDKMKDGWKAWLAWHQAIAPDNKLEIDALVEDQGLYLGYVRAVARKKRDVISEEPVLNIPFEYKKTPLLQN